jgi:iron complex outermembrane recepter protein
MKKIVLLIIFLTGFVFANTEVNAQKQWKKVSEMTKDELYELTYDDLLALSFEDLILAANKFGMSSEDLLDLFLNKDVTSASKRTEKSINSPLSSTVISREEIVNSGATNIPEILRLAPGLIVREKTTGNYDVQIRGNDNMPPKNMYVYSENSMTLVMIDGRPVYNYAFGGTFWETLPIEIPDIERIEIIRGPSSALYGPNAVSGVINIITRKVEKKQFQNEDYALAGNNNSKIYCRSIAFGSDKFKVRLSGNYTHFNRFEQDLYVFDLNKKYPKSQLDTMHYFWKPERKPMLIEANLDKSMPDPQLATDKFGLNAFFDYQEDENLGFNLALGTQKSDVITSSLGNHETPFFGRTSNTKYIDARAHIYGFQGQLNYLWGDQDIEKGNPGWHIQPTMLNWTVEYEQKLFGVVLRPGIGYQSAVYDDTKYSNYSSGFLNGECTLNSFAYYLRADYKAFDKLRFIAALRGDKYNIPDKNYFTYQFISSYDINQKNVVRIVYSRANRGPFIVDSYANFNWVVIPANNYNNSYSLLMPPYRIEWKGNQNLKLPVMDMFELGYRAKFSKKVMFEFEAFRTVTSDYSYFLPDSVLMYTDYANIRQYKNPKFPVFNMPQFANVGYVSYHNVALKSIQSGITFNVSVSVNSKVNLMAFGTFQQTKLENYNPNTYWQNLDAMNYQNFVKLATQVYMDTSELGVLNPIVMDPSADSLTKRIAGARVAAITMKTPVYTAYNPDIDSTGNIKKSNLINTTNRSTPSFYGGLVVDYKPWKRWTINSSWYFYTGQTFLHNKINDIGSYDASTGAKIANYNPSDYKAAYTIEPKLTVNLKISLKFWKESTMFIDARNLFSSSKREFAFMDRVNGLYLVGINLIY